MAENRIAAISLAALNGSLDYSRHYNQQFLSRPTPNRDEIRFLLIEDAPEIIEDYPLDPRGPSCLIWGMTDYEGRIGHLICANPPNTRIVTAYFPGETEPEEWECNYRRRVRRGTQ